MIDGESVTYHSLFAYLAGEGQGTPHHHASAVVSLLCPSIFPRLVREEARAKGKR
jgi:hypothetical protein